MKLQANNTTIVFVCCRELLAIRYANPPPMLY